MHQLTGRKISRTQPVAYLDMSDKSAQFIHVGQGNTSVNLRVHKMWADKETLASQGLCYMEPVQ
jgi:hypothetical protein